MNPTDGAPRLRWPLVLVWTLLLSGCGQGDGSNWPQFHADGASAGANFVATDYALRPAWEFEVGEHDFGQPVSWPVVGPDGTIYVGNLAGDMIAVEPDGTEKWRATTSLRILSSPAVAEDGTVYAVGTSFFPDAEISDDRFRSTLITIDDGGDVVDLTLVPDGYTAGSPKVWTSGRTHHVFLYANTRRTVLNSHSNALFVFDAGGNVVLQQDLGCSLPLTGGPSIFDLLKELHRLVGGVFDGSGLPAEPDDYGWVDPTVAVAARPDVVGEGNAIVLVADQACSNLWGFRWDPPDLEQLWFVDEEDRFIPSSSPALLADASLAVVGREDGEVIAYDPADGDELWTYQAGEEVLGTPASLIRQIYVASRSHIQALEPATGELVWKRELEGTTSSSPVVSASHVYVSHTGGLQTLDLVLASLSVDASGSNGGAGSPAIGDDGYVYTIVTRDGTVYLRAYPPS